ncbi:peptidase S9 prolyl oligopeptidase active site domain protein [Oscillochloris trichoides DG-6]|uniref:Peptidase S9 prolyl oligopeptidase active site domain protein n=1 Tax=Oscillochloris trichoides DG-6 TaxID=765420 RepID=E1IF71_9CHLR|nr:S9 family peptidase [Oscillochloris trichoides]EFO80170.1 peptidase S9 prolyl oligopeptidase active site domain protein [Oscillochloris trichoides DG-6]
MSQHTFGLWPSPISPRSLAGDIRLSDVQWDSDGQHVVWLEGRGGRGVLVCAEVGSADAPRDLTPTEFSVRAKIGYGGGDFCVGHGTVFFVDGGSGRIWRQSIAGGSATPVTPAFGHAAAPAISPDGRWLIYVHSDAGVDCLAVVPADGSQWPQRLIAGHDFFMQPCWHPSGKQVAYVAWDFPNMPWDGSGLYLADLEVSERMPVARMPNLIAGGTEVAIFQPCFAPDGRYLAYVSDESGWGHVYVRDLEQNHVHQISSGEVEHGHPAWIQGMRNLSWSSDSRRIYALRSQHGLVEMCSYGLDGSSVEQVQLGADYQWLGQPSTNPKGDGVACLAASSTIPSRIVVQQAEQTRILRRSAGELVHPAQLASAQPVTWESSGGARVHGMLYLPIGYSPGQSGPRPPAIVRIHGGPTGQATASYSGATQFFTSRGYTVLDVNYRGSTGYGREYMLALRDAWGVCDIEDAISAVGYLAASGAADPERVVIYGGSSGGYTVLEALCRAPGTFRAGICLYGVSNLFTLAADTHKFEARYLDLIVGQLPEHAERYRERSPIFHADLIRDPVAIFQGAEDTIVPPSQSEEIVAALRRREVPHIYHLYPGEGHGWRKPETIEAFYSHVERFLQQYVLFG